nr:hypothetical protein [Tanacetum cinerariifolium]
MYDRAEYDSWLQRIRLYCRGKENGIYILQLIDHGPFELGTTRDTLGTTSEGCVLFGPKRPRTYDDFNDNEKNDSMLISVPPILCFKDYPKTSTSSSVTILKKKQFGTTSKCFLMDLSSPKKTKNLNCMMNLNASRCFQVKTSMSTMFMTAVKLNKGLKETNHEQMYAYLKQHEKHAAQDRLITEIVTPTTNDQLAFVSSVQPYTQSSPVLSHQYPPSSTPLQSPHV